jgi:predicted nicotinamide N-methyase
VAGSLLAGRHPMDGEAYDVFEGHHPAVDDRQAGGDAAGLDLLAVVAAAAGAARVIEREAAATDREMTAVGAKRARDVFTVIP